MSSYYLKIEKIYNGTPILIERKKVKNVHLKVYRNLTVKCSFPESANDEYIDQFFAKRISWINKQLEKYKEATGADNYECLRNGSCVQMLGKDYRIYIKDNIFNRIEEDVKTITIYTKDTKNGTALKRQFMMWLRNKAESVFSKTLDDKFEKIIKKYKMVKPKLKVRSMKTMWGTFNDRNNTVTINDYLLKASILLIEYVILHELTHTLYRNHNMDFYNFMTIHMPDWQERKKSLDAEIAQGIV